MDYANAVWQIGIFSLVAGIMIGILAYRHLGPSKKAAEQFKKELDDAREEMAGYKANVDQHFDKTSELVNDLTQNYVKVYQHLAEGAQSLGVSKSFDNLLEQHQGRVSIAVDVDTNKANVIADESIVDPTSVIEEPVTGAEAEPYSTREETTAQEAEPASANEETVAQKADETEEAAAAASDESVTAESDKPKDKVEANTVPADIDQDESSATRH